MVLSESALLGLWFGWSMAAHYWLLYWSTLTWALLVLSWVDELVRVARQLAASRTLGVGAVILLQQVPAVKGLTLDFVDAFAVYFGCFMLVKSAVA